MASKASAVRRKVNAIAGDLRISTTELAAASRVERTVLSKFLNSYIRTLPAEQIERIDVAILQLASKRLAVTLKALLPKENKS